MAYDKTNITHYFKAGEKIDGPYGFYLSFKLLSSVVFDIFKVFHT